MKPRKGSFWDLRYGVNNNELLTTNNIPGSEVREFCTGLLIAELLSNDLHCFSTKRRRLVHGSNCFAPCPTSCCLLPSKSNSLFNTSLASVGDIDEIS